MGVVSTKMAFDEDVWQKALENCVPAKFLELNKKDVRSRQRGKIMDEISGLIIKMTEFFGGDPKRIQHFIKVHTLARVIGRAEGA